MPKNNGNVLHDQLEDAYDEALKNKNFQALVVKLKMKREDLINYTSALEESAVEYGHCKDCPGLPACQNKISGYAYLPKKNEGNLEFSYRICKYKKRYDKQNKYLDNTYTFKVPKEIKEASFDKIYKADKKRYKVIDWLNDFMLKYNNEPQIKGLYLYGNFGSGKTYLIAAMFNELAKKHEVKSAIVFWPEFLRELKLLLNGAQKSEFNDKFNKIKKAPLLLIDDLGAETSTDWSRDEILCPILQYRMEEKLPTFITSNFKLEDLENHLSVTSRGDEIVKAGRIISRINQLCEYEELISKNLRK